MELDTAPGRLRPVLCLGAAPWRPHPRRWGHPPPAGPAVSYVPAPLTGDTTAVGGGAVHLWVKSSTPDVDLQATISEVRPDGKERFAPNRVEAGNRTNAAH